MEIKLFSNVNFWIKNQMAVLQGGDKPAKRLEVLCNRVSSGDAENIEAQAASFYWTQLFGTDFVRDRYGAHPNNLLNYG